MRHIRLTAYQRERLRVLTRSSDRFIARKAIALLELDDGATLIEAGQHLGVTRHTVRRWAKDFGESDLRTALKDRRASSSGRPAKWNARLAREFRKSLKIQPDRLGYQAVSWTAELLSIHLAKKTGIELSADTLRRRLHENNFAWKRPRYQFITDTQKRKKTSAPALVSAP